MSQSSSAFKEMSLVELAQVILGMITRVLSIIVADCDDNETLRFQLFGNLTLPNDIAISLRIVAIGCQTSRISRRQQHD